MSATAATTTTSTTDRHVRVEHSMKAITRDRYGTLEVLRFHDIDRRRVGPHEVLVQVRAAGVNQGDVLELHGWPSALERVETGHAGGRVVVTVGSSTSEARR